MAYTVYIVRKIDLGEGMQTRVNAVDTLFQVTLGLGNDLINTGRIIDSNFGQYKIPEILGKLKTAELSEVHDLLGELTYAVCRERSRREKKLQKCAVGVQKAKCDVAL